MQITIKNVFIIYVPFTVFQNRAANIEAGAQFHIDRLLIMIFIAILANEFRLFFTDGSRLLQIHRNE